MKRSYTILIFIASIITTIIVVGLFVFFLNVIKNKNEHISAVFSALEEKIAEKENARIFSEKISEIKLIDSNLDDYFVNPNTIDTFVGYLEGIGPTMGVGISVNGVEVPTKTKNLITFKLSVKGSFQNVARTISFLENIPYQINITQFYLNKGLKSQDADELNKEIDLSVTLWQADISFDILSS